MPKYLFYTAFALLALVVLPTASPQYMFSAAAWADDDDDDDDGDNGEGRGSGPGNEGSRGEGRPPGNARPGGNLLDLIFGRTPRRTAEQPPAPQPLPTRATDEIVVLDLSQEDLSTLIALGYAVIREADVATLGTTVRRLQVPTGTSLDAGLETIRQLPSGQSSDFNHFYRVNEEHSHVCEGLHCPSFTLVNWTPDVSGAGLCGQPTPRIGLIDTGINPDHTAFDGSQLSVLNFESSDQTASGAQHGTAVAALLIGSREGRAHGLLPGAQLVSVDAFYTTGRDERSDVFNLVLAMDQLATAGVSIINMSLAGPHNTLLERMVSDVSKDQILIVSAAGNGGPRAAPVFPGAYEPVLTVTAVDASGRVYRRAGRGPHVDLAAPGVDVWTAASIRGVRSKTGTSFAVPFATAAAAVLMSAKPELTVAEVKSFLRDTALDLGESGPDEVFGAGLVQFAPICTDLQRPKPLLME